MLAIDGLDRLLETAQQPALQELRSLLPELLPRHGSGARLVAEQMLLNPRVHRLRFEIDDRPYSIVVKHFTVRRALREQSAIVRWLPSAGFGAHVPALLGTVAAVDGEFVWHAYEDLGDSTLDHGPFDPDRVRAAVEVIARVHVRFAGHRMVGEIRTFGGDFGPGFYGVCVRDAANALRSVTAAELSTENLALRDRLLRRLDGLQREQHVRTATMAEVGGVETLVHGDLWTKNILVLASDCGGRRPALLIDWDHVGVGPVAYDLSVLLLRFDRDQRPWVLDLYRAAVEREAGWRLPDNERMNHMFETCELSRLAHTLLWPAIAASEPSADWAFERLAEIESWFESLQPVLP